MLPVWIIDLGSSVVSSVKLRSLLDSTGESFRPFWHYYHVADRVVSDTASCKALVEELVTDGRDCYNAFIKTGYKIGNFQIVILGAANERLTQSAFAPLPGLLRDNLPRIISDHANLGVEITGVLYIPSTINQLDSRQEREKVAMMLEDLNMLDERLGPKHFSRVVAYQDVQYKGVRFYAGLDEEQRTEFLFQILTNLFFVRAGCERLFDRIGKGSGIFSLGVSSIFYSSGRHRAIELKRILDKLIAEFKDTDNKDDECSGRIVREVLEEDAVNADAISVRFREECGSLDVDLRKMDGEADPHPVWDLFRAELFPSYYKKYLKFTPARLTRYMQSVSYALLSRFSGIIRKNRKKATESFRTLLSGLYRKVLLDSASKFPTIAQLESVFNAAKDYLNRKRAEVILGDDEIVPVPEYLRHEYDKCLTDEGGNTSSKIMERLGKNLKREPVVLSLLVRCFLLGILLVFTIIPVLRVVSPKVINLGEIATIEWLWIPVLFFLPLTIEFFIRLRRHFKRVRRLKYRLLASTLLAVNKRLSRFLMDEQGIFYEELAKECDVHLGNLAQFREKLTVPDAMAGKEMIPETMFNQPLMGGMFCGEKLLEDTSVSEAEIHLRDGERRLSELEKEDLLALLKSSFVQSGTLDAADLSYGGTPDRHADSLVAILGRLFGPKLHIHTADSIGRMLDILGGDVNVAPLERMAGVNGMLFSVPSDNPPVLRISNVPRVFGNINTVTDDVAPDYAMLTCWQKLDKGIKSRLVCNCPLDPLPELSFADKLSLYYGFYRRRDLAYSLAGTPLRISKAEMDELDKSIGG